VTWKFATIIIAYAAALIAVGYVGMSVAPPGANAATALIIPLIFALLMLLCLALAFLIKSNRALGMIGIHAALVLPLVAAAGSFSRLAPSIASADSFNTQLQQIQETVAKDADRPARIVNLALATPDRLAPTRDANAVNQEQARVLVARTAGGDLLFEAEAASEWRPRGYQAVSLFAVAALSIFAFVALITHRPKVPKAEPKARPAPKPAQNSDSN